MTRYKHQVPLRVVADSILQQMRAEGYIDRNCDDDQPAAPDRYDSIISAQSRRLPVEVH